MKNWQIEFYLDEKGFSPVKEYVKNLSAADRNKVFYTINLLKSTGIYLREPHSKKLEPENNLFELRSQFLNNIQRIIYFHFTGKTFVLLHGFTKKTQKTPKKEITLAIKRKNDYLRRYK